VVAIQLVTRRATASAWAGLLAGAILAALGLFARASVSALEPKILVVFFSLVASLAVQRRNWLGTGLGAGLAGMCWQPGVLVALCTFPVALWSGRESGWRPLRDYAAGMALALLPALVYLTLTDTWWDFLQRSIAIPAASQIPRIASSPSRWALGFWKWFVSERVFLLAAGVGLAFFAVESARHGPRSLVRVWLDPAMGAVPLLTVAWMAFCTIEFQGRMDLIPLLPLVAFWPAWLAWRGVEAFARRLGSSATRSGSRLPPVLAALLLVAGSYAALRDRGAWYAPGYGLDDQRSLVDEITAGLAPEDAIVAFHAEELLVLSGRPSLAPFLRPVADFMNFSELLGPGGCEGVMLRLIEQEPALFVIQRHPRAPCAEWLEKALPQAGYRHRQAPVGHRGVAWQVYRRSSG
jgi:hypothetical protein